MSAHADDTIRCGCECDAQNNKGKQYANPT